MEKCLVITVDKDESLIKDLEEFGYEKRGGGASYTRNFLVIVPKKKWYWLTGNSIKGMQKQNL
jgi:hypothetical protein